jgi:chromosome segregation ATPase
MRRVLGLGLLALAAAGCATAGWPFGDATTLLARADRLTDRQQYEPALRMYDEFLTRYASDPAAPRALKSRDAVASIITARAELARLRNEIAARDAELAKLRQETERLRADLEKLKEVDLNLERKKR